MQTEMQTALILIRLFLFRPVLFAQKNCKVAGGCGSCEINFQIYKTHIKPIKPPKIVSEYDQEIPQSQTADNPVAPRGRAAQPSQDTRKTN